MDSKIASSLVALASLTAAANADVGVVEATGQFQLAGGSSSTCVSAIGAAWNPRLNGYDFGSVNTLTGQSLLLQNWYFENYAYNGGGTPPGGTTTTSTGTFSVVPGPGALALLGVAGIVGARKRR